MQSVYQIAAEAAKSVVTVRGEQDAANLTKDVNDEDMGCTGLIAADNGQELLILSNNSVCGEIQCLECAGFQMAAPVKHR